MRSWLTVQFLSGALCAGYLVACVFFLRFWRDTRDSLFIYFGAAFFLLAFQRLFLASVVLATPSYLLRLAAFLLLLWAIIDKNRTR
ncbi:MAG: DUF5985 family protein [Acidobacteriota bacterium]